ncbi:hypothetical protein [Pseudomonas juntendi]|uniref:hypothetical protein n=1 Tax=Pseudomonas juntendi TaxID=2666183 RepID=UPI002448CF72|nr:hypothetical protein [Pseudomonas juntendi]MDG9889256.1 hypothetical protein [Pseudomonas juntendi]
MNKVENTSIFHILGVLPQKIDPDIIENIDRIWDKLIIEGSLISKELEHGEHPLTNSGLEKAYENIVSVSISKEDIDNIS